MSLEITLRDYAGFVQGTRLAFGLDSDNVIHLWNRDTGEEKQARLIDPVHARMTHFEAISKGVIDLRDVIFFVSLIVSALVVNTALVELKKGD